eukprot:Ihof_evm3s63 gene=Ihof_evmTU3s63
MKRQRLSLTLSKARKSTSDAIKVVDESVALATIEVLSHGQVLHTTETNDDFISLAKPSKSHTNLPIHIDDETASLVRNTDPPATIQEHTLESQQNMRTVIDGRVQVLRTKTCSSSKHKPHNNPLLQECLNIKQDKSVDVLAMLHARPAAPTTTCPMCQESVSIQAINIHLDKDCKGMFYSTTESETRNVESKCETKTKILHQQIDRKLNNDIKECSPILVQKQYEEWSCLSLLTSSLLPLQWIQKPCSTMLESCPKPFIDCTPTTRQLYKWSDLEDKMDEPATGSMDLDENKANTSMMLMNRTKSDLSEPKVHSSLLNTGEINDNNSVNNGFSREDIPIKTMSFDITNDESTLSPPSNTISVNSNNFSPSLTNNSKKISNNQLVNKIEVTDHNSMESLENNPESQKLYVRLFQRKPGWFCVAKLKYMDMDVETAAKELQAASLVDPSQGFMTLDESLSTMLLSDIVDLAQQHRVNVGKTINCQSRKTQYIQALSSYCKYQRSLFTTQNMSSILLKQALDKLGPCVRLCETTVLLFNRILLLFFLNTEHKTDSLTTLFLINTGKWKFPLYRIIRSIPDFTSITMSSNNGCSNSVQEDGRENQKPIERHDKRTECRKNALIDTIPAALEEEHALAIALQDGNDKKGQQIITDVSNRFSHMKERLGSKDTFWWEKRPIFLRRYLTEWVEMRMLMTWSTHLETKKRFRDASSLLRDLLEVDLLAPASRGRLWNRLALDLEHLKLLDETVAVCEKALADQHVRVAHRLQLVKRLSRLVQGRRSINPTTKQRLLISLLPLPRPPPVITISGYQMNHSQPAIKSVFITDGGERLVSVEDVAMDHYLHLYGEGWMGIHAENSIFLTLFTVLCWDIIFASIPDVFLTPFQDSPLDLYSDDFFRSRRNIVVERLSFIGECSDDTLRDLLESMWKQHYGDMAVGINWDLMPLQSWKSVAVCIGGKVLQAVFEVLCRDYRHWCAGLPDLTLWSETECRVVFAE